MALGDIADNTTLKHTTNIGSPNRKSKRSGNMAREVSSTSDVLLYFLALFLPPLSVFLKAGCGADFLINILLSILGWIPGVIHAWYIISKRRTVYVEPVK